MNFKELKTSKVIYNFCLVFIILIGIFIRTKLYLVKGILEDDECRIAIAMFDKRWWEMFLPVGPFSSTPIFLFISKIIANLTNYNEYALYTIPFLASIAGIIYFYKLSLIYYKKKISVLAANFLFAVNFKLILFSAIFKQYSIEVLTTIICLYYFPKIDIYKLTKKQCIILAAVLALLPLISLPSLFLIVCFIIINTYEHLKEKYFYKKLILCIIPLTILMIIYYVFNLMPTKELQYLNFAHFWNQIYAQDILSAISSLFSYIASPNPLIICHILLIVLFFVTACFKEKRSKTDIYIIIFFVLFLLAHLFKLYPIFGRAAQYCIPIIFLMWLKAFDSIDKNKILILITSLIFVLGFLCYFIPDYTIALIKNTKQSFITYSPKKMLMTIQENFNEDTDIIVIDEASSYCFVFYNKKLNFNTENYKSIRHDEKGRITKENDFRQLNALDNNKHYWFYLIKEFSEAPERIYIMEWLAKQNIKYANKEYDSYLYYIVPPYEKIVY